MSVKFDSQLLAYIKFRKYSLIKPFLNEDLCKASDHWGTLLHYAALYDCCYCILDMFNLGCDVNSLNRYGETPLLIAMRQNHHRTVRELLSVNADIHYAGPDVLSAKQMLVQSPFKFIRILKYFFPKIRSEYSTAEEFMQRLIDVGFTAYHAAYSGCGQVLEALLERGIDVNSRGIHNITALMAAAQLGNYELVKMLISRGADIDARDEHQMNALHWAAIRENIIILQFLLDAGANINARSSGTGHTPLHIVFRYVKNEEQADRCAELLILREALPQNANHGKILDIARKNLTSYRIRLLISQIAMLDLMGSPIIKSLTGSTVKEYRTKYPKYGKYHDFCQQILILPIDESLNFLDFLNESEHQMRIHVRNEKFMCQLADFHLEENLAEQCPLYSKKLEKRISDTRRTLELENIAFPILFRIINANDHIVAREIISYLSKTDLENFCQIED